MLTEQEKEKKERWYPEYEKIVREKGRNDIRNRKERYKERNGS